MRAHIVGDASHFPYQHWKRIYKLDDLVIAADGGATRCLELNIVPNLIVGDFDSLSPEIEKSFPNSSIRKPYPRHKDETDLTLAIQEALEKKVSEVFIWGWADERIDYSLGALLSLADISVPTELYTETSRIQILNRAHPLIEWNQPPSQKLSIIGLGSDTQLHSEGLRWNLTWKNRASGPHLSQSNEALGPGSLHLTEGYAFVLWDLDAV